jgi:hypothetical protein
VLLQLFHRGVQSPTVDVEVAARRAPVRVPENPAHERDWHPRFLKPRTGFVAEVAENHLAQRGHRRSSTLFERISPYVPPHHQTHRRAEQRLVELAEEARTIFAAFPELREQGAGLM